MHHPDPQPGCPARGRLGARIDLAPVNLDVTSVPGAGGSLRSLLGAVTQLVDNGGPLQSIAALLNVLLTGLGL